MKEGYEKYCRFFMCDDKECWYNGCQCEGERLIIPKETLEEASERLTYSDTLSWENTLSKASFIAGAKWQQERSYSEETNYLQGFINQFKEQLSNDDWTVSQFLEWMKLNNFVIIKNEKHTHITNR